MRILIAGCGYVGSAAARAQAGRRARSNKRCSNRRLRAADYRFRFPTFREGYGAMLAAPGDGVGG